MYVLTRIISPYDGHNLCLGIFSTEESALKARKNHLRSIEINDPWTVQTYRTVNIESDLRLVKVDDHRDQTNQSQVMYLVIAYYDELGQVYGEFLAIFSEKNKAEEFALRTEEVSCEKMPSWCDVVEVVPNVAG
ncbi:MAG: hypothetical protein ACFE0I_20680 [Elainellaceae cyanobacterium]